MVSINGIEYLLEGKSYQKETMWLQVIHIGDKEYNS